MDAAGFRAFFPEFEDSPRFSNAVVEAWTGLAAKLLPADRWGDLLDLGTALYAAHNLALGAQAAKGAVPGLSTGPVSGKTVGQVSVQYDTSAGLATDAAHWNLTVYGVRFISLARMVGIGGAQL